MAWIRSEDSINGVYVKGDCVILGGGGLDEWETTGLLQPNSPTPNLFGVWMSWWMEQNSYRLMSLVLFSLTHGPILLLQHETGRRNGPCRSILLCTINSCLHRSFEIRFHSIMWGISVPTPRIWHAKCRGRCQPFEANTKISYKVGNWHSSPSLRKENTADEPHFLKRRRLHAFTFRIFTGLLNLNPKLLPHPNSPSPEKRRGLFGEDY